jgi:hypothetical protein
MASFFLYMMVNVAFVSRLNKLGVDILG